MDFSQKRFRHKQDVSFLLFRRGTNSNVDLSTGSGRFVPKGVVVMDRRSTRTAHLFFTPRFELAPPCHSSLVVNQCTHGIVLGFRRH